MANEIVLSTVISDAVAETSHATGTTEFTLAAGKSLKVETSPDGDEIFDEEVPVGKSWGVTITVSYAETDA